MGVLPSSIAINRRVPRGDGARQRLTVAGSEPTLDIRLQTELRIVRESFEHVENSDGHGDKPVTTTSNSSLARTGLLIAQLVSPVKKCSGNSPISLTTD